LSFHFFDLNFVVSVIVVVVGVGIFTVRRLPWSVPRRRISNHFNGHRRLDNILAPIAARSSASIHMLVTDLETVISILTIEGAADLACLLVPSLQSKFHPIKQQQAQIWFLLQF
jgi:hypothetical protein